MTRECMLHFTRYKDTTYSRETGDLDIISLQIYWSTHMPKITKIELGLTKLLQNKMVQFFYSQCRTKPKHR